MFFSRPWVNNEQEIQVSESGWGKFITFAVQSWADGCARNVYKNILVDNHAKLQICASRGQRWTLVKLGFY